LRSGNQFFNSFFRSAAKRATRGLFIIICHIKLGRWCGFLGLRCNFIDHSVN
jgi:hypothetical protein